jgi:hypothetical protein
MSAPDSIVWAYVQCPRAWELDEGLDIPAEELDISIEELDMSVEGLDMSVEELDTSVGEPDVSTEESDMPIGAASSNSSGSPRTGRPILPARQ